MRSTTGTRPTAGTVPFVDALARHGERVALVHPAGSLTYTGLTQRIREVAARLGPGRRLVLVEGGNRLEAVVTYLAALAAGHVVMLVPGDSPTASAAALDAYDPDVVAGQRDGAWTLSQRRAGSAHALHPDLALLLSTSGSTGSPKLVRLSHSNLQANAEAIVESLGVRDTDRAVTTLPVHYCYGLSVLHSHLLVGAGVVLTDLSVVDSCFWDLVRREQVTTFAGVPHTFDLLDRVGFADLDLPSLRYVTQAGGRMAPETVRRYAELGGRRGWDLVVMYGQTEATARMAVLPADLAVSRPGSIGAPVPGGTFLLRPVDGGNDLGPGRGQDGGEAEEGPSPVGELVYRGPNVMLGYAESPADLALGRTVHELATGDLARRGPDGLYEVVGRRSRFVKVFGLRVDLDRVERLLAEQGTTAVCAGTDEGVVVACPTGAAEPASALADTEHVHRTVCDLLGLPRGSVRVVTVPEVPRTASGKPDYPAVLDLATAVPTGAADPQSLLALYAQLLDRPDATLDDTFVSLGGDSLSYVEMSVRLEQALGRLPTGWHTTAIGDLGRPPRRRRLAVPVTETSVALRAAAIVLIVGTHIGVVGVLGSAHVLLAVAGYNFARFGLTGADRLARARHQLTSVARIAVPTGAWVAATLAVTDAYGWPNVFLLNGLVGPETWTSSWHFWFVEVLVYTLVVLTALLAVPWADRAERTWPFAVPAVVVGVGLLTRYELVPSVLHTKPVLWLFALGWATARAATLPQKAAVALATAVTVPGFFGEPWRDALILGGLQLLLWAPAVPCPRWLARVAGVLASSSLYVYVTHWQVYPLLRDVSGAAALVVSLLVGVAYWRLVLWTTPRVKALLRPTGSWVRGVVRPGGRDPAPLPTLSPGVRQG